MNYSGVGLIFISCLSVGSGVGLLFGALEAGGAIGLGAGILFTAIFRKSK
ncbi:hypothetical protein QNH47_14335 [Virgibacillus halodenitrificans]|nr:hypothetical protein [Virgibacillus halodenitrificans]WHX25327.1 hypothetical protein QNH47_14335 [Virgibacillus halodenitrificans]